LKLEEKPLNISLLKPKCDKQNGELIWKDHRWTCAIKSTREEIEKAQTPPLKSPTPLIQEKAILQLNNQKTEEILNFDFSDDGKYLTTYSVNSSHYVARAFKLATMESLSSLTFSKSKHSRLHKNMLFVFGSDNDDFEIINLVNNKSLLALPNSKVRSIAITNNDKFLVLSSYKNLSIYDTKNWKLHCSIPVRHVDLGYRNILDISKPLFYENIDGQKAALDIATGQNITPLPSLPPRFGYEIKTPSPDSLPIELNATKNKLYYSGDFHYAIEAGRESFNIWDLEKKVILSTKKGALIDYLGSIKTTKDYAIFHAVIGTRSTYLLDFNNPSVLKQLTYSTERPLYYKQQKNSNILETGGKIGWDFNSAGTILTKPFPFHQDLMGQIRYFSNGKHAAIVGGGNQVLYYDLLNNKELAKFGGGKWTHETTSTQIELSPDESKIVATANHERDIIVWDVNQSKIDYTIPNSAKWGNPFVITPDSQNIISLSYSPSDGEAKGLGYHPYQGTLNVWNFKTGVLERSLPKRATTFALIPNTHLLALGENDGTISIWDYRNGLERFRLNGHEHKIESLTLIHHGHTLLSRDAHSKMIRWEYIQNDPKGTKMLHGIPYRTELSHNENYMLITQEDYKKEGKIRLLNLKTSQYEYEFPFPTSYAMRKTFSNDDKYFFLSTPENATKVFQTATGKELATLQAYDNGEWIIMTPQGYFNASSKGREFIIDASGNTIDDATYKKYFNPEKVKDILNPREPR
jgi:WD40 repeat protein